jgi:hypothetical protein
MQVLGAGPVPAPHSCMLIWLMRAQQAPTHLCYGRSTAAAVVLHMLLVGAAWAVAPVHMLLGDAAWAAALPVLQRVVVRMAVASGKKALLLLLVVGQTARGTAASSQ